MTNNTYSGESKEMITRYDSEIHELVQGIDLWKRVQDDDEKHFKAHRVARATAPFEGDPEPGQQGPFFTPRSPENERGFVLWLYMKKTEEWAARRILLIEMQQAMTNVLRHWEKARDKDRKQMYIQYRRE